MSASAVASLLLAERADLEGDLVAALAAADDAIAADPKSAFLRLRRGQWRLQHGDATAALVDARTAGAGAGHRLRSGASLLEARSLRELGSNQEAVAAWQRAVAESAEDPGCRRDDCAGVVAHEELMDALLAAGDEDGAVAYAEATSKMMSGSGLAGLRAQQQLARALLLHARGAPAAMTRAQAVQAELLTRDGNDELAQRLRVHTLLLLGDDDGALKWLTTVASGESGAAFRSTWITVATLAGESIVGVVGHEAGDVDAAAAAVARGGQFVRAAAMLREAGEADGAMVIERHRVVVEWLLAAGQLSEAAPLACREHARDSPWLCALAMVEAGAPLPVVPAKLQADAVGAAWAEAWTTWLTIEPPGKQLDALIALGMVLMNHDDHRMAGVALLDALKRGDLVKLTTNVDDPQATLAMSSHLESSGDLEGAFAADAHHLRNHDSRAVKNHAAYLVAEHPQQLAAHLEEAQRWAWQLVVDDPLSGALMDTWGWVQLQAARNNDDTKRACASLERANRLLPHQSEILVHVATCWHRVKDDDRAQAALQQARAALRRTDRYRKIIDKLTCSSPCGDEIEQQWHTTP